MNIEPVAVFHSPFNSKFGIPKQSGIVEALKGEIVFLPAYRNPDALRGFEAFAYLGIQCQQASCQQSDGASATLGRQ